MLRYDSSTVVFGIKHVQFNQDLYSSWPCFNRKTAVSWSLSREFITLCIDYISFQTVESDCLLAALSWTCFSYLQKYCCNSIHFYWTGLALALAWTDSWNVNNFWSPYWWHYMAIYFIVFAQHSLEWPRSWRFTTIF